MDYNTFEPSEELASLINFYWTLEVAAEENPAKQIIVPDGGIELVFILGDDIRRFISETEFVLQPRAMILGQTSQPFYVQPTGYVNSFAASFSPFGFSLFVDMPLKELRNKETPIAEVFGQPAADRLEQAIIDAPTTKDRIKAVEAFLLDRLTHQQRIEGVVQKTVQLISESNGQLSIDDAARYDASQQRQLERKFLQQVGMSPKQLCKLVRMQSALKLLLNQEGSLTDIAHDSRYYDQSHFIKDFKHFTGVSPSKFLLDKSSALSTAFYK
ncbi:AraC family transcriptional regulator [Bacterioplanes sanyensis]|uniref:AraC family transcriptional regulator n=1 Tax=Bacterioplanes sanyensis TaxID=1249553 RepID=A0A222FNV3_9GAMM|nr:helix-turn-helix transcriptional regulator [Bacterioplanes sanyensis]ASP40216.1 AraC family transcriptional regulator [Bacterioplanes sanyensis]